MYRFPLPLLLSILVLAPACKKQPPPPAAAEEVESVEVESEPAEQAALEIPTHVQEMTKALERTFFELDSSCEDPSDVG